MKAGAAFFIAAIAACSPAFAGDKGLAAPPPPKSTAADAVEAWIKRYIKDDGWHYAASSDIGAVMISPSTMQVSATGTVRFWYRTELFAPDFSDGRIVRSFNMLQEIDCAQGKIRYLAGDAYLENSMGGAVVSSTNTADAEWEYARPGTVAEIVGDQVCEYIDKVVAEAKEESAETAGIQGHF